MSRSIFNASILRKYLIIFRQKASTGREKHWLHTSAGKRRQFSIRDLTSPLYTTSSQGYIINSYPSPSSSSTPSPLPPQPAIIMPILPNHRLLARAFHRKSLRSTVQNQMRRNISQTTNYASKTNETVTSSNWQDKKENETVMESDDSHNVQKDAADEGMKEKAKGEQSGSEAISEKDGKDSNKRAKEEHPEAPGPVLGMNDERGGKGY